MRFYFIALFLSSISLSAFAGEYRYSKEISHGIDENGNTVGIAVDSMESVPVFIGEEHHEVHAGNHYNITGSTTLAAGTICEFILKTPDTDDYIHLIWDYQSNVSSFTHVAYEDVTVSTNGASSVTPLNNNRNSANTSDLLVWRSTGTSTTSSTILSGPFILGSSGNPQTRVGGMATHEQERILKRNTWYVFRFTNGADAQTINFRSNWYE